MRNVNITREGSDIVIRVKADQFTAKAATLSSTGKTKLLASTGGAVAVDCPISGVKVALNVTMPLA